MKLILPIITLLVFHITALSQNAYIQVNGEPGLTVFLDGQFKGKTTAEYNGYIIENVKPGTHLIKIVKEGYVPFEENISVKQGEVLAYKVKPFSKHVISISEKGNSDATEKKAEITTGKLIIQSVPIEIKISIEDVEGADNVAKTKDQWIADKVPVGNYRIKFVFNNKTIQKTVDIFDNATTRVFVNMLNGDFTAHNNYNDGRILKRFSDSLTAIYFFKPGLTKTQFQSNVPELRNTYLKTGSFNFDGFQATSYYPEIKYSKKQENMSNKGCGGFQANSRGEIVSCGWTLEANNLNESAYRSLYENIKAKIKATIPEAYWRENNQPRSGIPKERIIITVPDDSGNDSLYITYSFIDNKYVRNVYLNIGTNKQLAEW